ncbi:hypothetical protein BFP70_03975 [Thioclava sp. SK-1]|nr:hypothetical protein BFP70_03975 [Thioclava sp. SK-1]
MQIPTPERHERASGPRCLPTHILDGKQYLLSIPAQADRGQHRDVRGLVIQPGFDGGAIKVKPHDLFIGQVAGAPCIPIDLYLAPGAADHIIAHCAVEQVRQRPFDPPCIGADQIDRRD